MVQVLDLNILIFPDFQELTKDAYLLNLHQGIIPDQNHRWVEQMD